MLMELRQLEYLVAVAEEANFTRAAERIHVAQPAVSAQIAAAGTRTGPTAIRPVATGGAADGRRRSGAAIRAGGLGGRRRHARRRRRAHATWCAEPSDRHGDLAQRRHPALLADFHADHPNVEITLGTDSSDASSRMSAPDGSTSAIVVGRPRRAPGRAGGARSSPTRPSRRSSAAPTHWPSGRRSGWPTWATGHSSRCPSAQASAISSTTPARRRASRPRIAFEASTPTALADLAERGLGWRSCPRRCRGAATRCTRWPSSPEIRGRLVLAWRSSGPISPAARVLIDRARRLLRVSARA